MFRVQDKMCPTCIYRPDSPLDLQRLERESLSKDAYRICHHSDDVCCRGFWNNHSCDFNLGRIAQRLGAVEFVAVDTLAGKSRL